MLDVLDWLNTGSNAGSLYCFWLSLATGIFTRYLEKRNHVYLRAGVSVILFYLIGTAVPPALYDNVPTYAVLWYITAYFLNTAVIFSYCRISIWEALSCAMFAALTEHLASSAYILIFVGKWNWDLTFSAISMGVYILVWLLVGRKMAHNGHYHVKPETVMLTSGIVMMVLVILSYSCKYTADPSATMAFESETVRTMLQLSQWYAIAFCLVTLNVELARQVQLQTQLDLAASHELMRVREQQYRMTRDNIDLINRKCHDMKHQLKLLMEQEGGDADLKAKYNQEVSQMIEVYDNNVDAGNEVLNTILRDKSLFCSMHGITWTCMAQGEALDFVEKMDLATLMGNALDNALEAVERIPDHKKRIINVQICPRNNMMQILIENSFDGMLNKIGNQLITRKDDREYHGIGVKSIIAIAEKYGGFATTDAEDNTFILNILIPIPEKNSREETYYGKNRKEIPQKGE